MKGGNKRRNVKETARNLRELNKGPVEVFDGGVEDGSCESCDVFRKRCVSTDSKQLQALCSEQSDGKIFELIVIEIEFSQRPFLLLFSFSFFLLLFLCIKRRRRRGRKRMTMEKILMVRPTREGMKEVGME